MAMSPSNKALLTQTVSIVVGLATIYVLFRVASAGWNASKK